MRYCLASTRKIGKYVQKCIVNYPNTTVTDPTTQGRNQFTNMTYFVGQLTSLDASGWSTGSAIFKSFTEVDDGITTNTGTKCDMTLDVISENSGQAKIYSLKLKSIAKANIAYSLITKIGALLSDTVPDANIYIVNVIFDLHD